MIIQFPVQPVNAKIVKRVEQSSLITYVFGASLRSTHQYKRGLWLSTNLNDEQGVPKFYATDETEISFKSDSKQIRLTKSDLVKGQRLWITAVYNPEKKTWETTKVTIKRNPSSTKRT